MWSAVMSLPALVIFVLGFLLQTPFQISLVHGAIIPRSVDITTMNETMNDGTPPYCNNLEGWVGDGIDPSDCAVAISEFLRTNVRPRGKQEYEFLARGVPRVSYLPWIVTPKKYDYGRYSGFGLGSGTHPNTIGTCDITIVMMKIFDPAVLPGGSPAVYTPSDIATFYDIWNTARNLLSFCVHRKFLPQAGWSITGKSA